MHFSDVTGKVTEASTRPQVASTMGRGYPGAFRRKVDSPFVSIALTVLFVAPFVDPRRLLRMHHLDLAGPHGLRGQHGLLRRRQHRRLGPDRLPLMAYLLGRMLWIGLRRGRRRDPLACSCRRRRSSSGSVPRRLWHRAERRGLERHRHRLRGVIRADRLADGDKLWGEKPQGQRARRRLRSVNYAAYVPFEQNLPWSRRCDNLPAAHAASIFFDLLCLGLLFLIGRRMRGPTLGLVLACAWAANPFTLYTLDCDVNDALVAALVLAAVAAASSPAGRSTFIALAGMAKVAPLALAPLFATCRAARCASSSAAPLALAPACCWSSGSQPARRSTTDAGLEASRGSPFSSGALRVGHGAGGRPGRRGAAGGRRRLPGAPARPRRALGAGDDRAHRAAARRHALVLPLHRVVPRAAAHRAAGRRRGRGAPRAADLRRAARAPTRAAMAWR